MNKPIVNFFVFLICFLMSCSSPKINRSELVENVNLQSYSGKWFEIAAYPNRFQKDCKCVTAEYELLEGKDYIRVFNHCIKKSSASESSIEGKAFPLESYNGALLKVQFFWPFRSQYKIIELADDYSWAVVAGKANKYLWILCRKPFMEVDLYENILERLDSRGIDTLRLVKTIQDCH